MNQKNNQLQKQIIEVIFKIIGHLLYQQLKQKQNGENNVKKILVVQNLEYNKNLKKILNLCLNKKVEKDQMNQKLKLIKC